MDAGDRTNHDYRDIGGRVTPGAVTEEDRVENDSTSSPTAVSRIIN